LNEKEKLNGHKKVEKLKELSKEELKELQKMVSHHTEVEKQTDKKLIEQQITENEKKELSETRNNLFPGYVKWVLAGAAVGIAFYFWWKRSQ